MNLTQFLRASSMAQVSLRGALFDSEEEALTCFDAIPSQYNPQQIGCLILYNEWDDYECWKIIREKCSAYYCHWWSILFASEELAKTAEQRIRSNFRTSRAVSRGSELLFDSCLDETELYYAISSSDVLELPGQCLFIPGIPDEEWWFNKSFCWLPIPFKENVFSSKPQILIRDLDAFDNGEDRTVWIDAAQEPETIIQMLAWWLHQSPSADVIAHRWCIIDVCNFPPKYEPEDLDELVEVSYVATKWEKHGKPWWVYFNKFRYTKKPAFEHPDVHFCGRYYYAEEYFQQEFRSEYENQCKEDGLPCTEEGFNYYCADMREQHFIVIQYQEIDYIYSVVE